MSTKDNIYVLSIGINVYKHPEIKDLHSCVKDVYNLKNCLQSNFNIPENQYKILTNEQATRNGIISSFREHFTQIKDGDILLFHYSGHGSWEKVSQEFSDSHLEVQGGRNEVLVCHDSSDLGIYNIADKELRLLLSEIQYKMEEEEVKNCHSIFLLDCCHSGSLLRNNDPDIRVRMTSAFKQSRPLSAYLEGQYTRSKKLRLVPANYITMAACAPSESAVENSTGGLFTQALIKTIETCKQQGWIPDYTELFTLIRAIILYDSRHIQHPQFEYAGAVNPYNSFLLQGAIRTISYPRIFREKEKWYAPVGTIHGLNAKNLQQMRVPVFTEYNPKVAIAYAIPERVELERTYFKSVIFTKENSLTDQQENICYLIGISNLKIPLKISLDNGAVSVKNQLIAELLIDQKQWFVSTELAAAYELSISTKQLLIYSNRNGDQQLIYGIGQVDTPSVIHIVKQLQKVAKWEQIYQLISPGNSLIEKDLVEWKFNYTDYAGQRHQYQIGEVDTEGNIRNPIKLKYEQQKGGFPYSFSVKNNTISKLYFYLIHLTGSFDIYQKNENYTKALYYGEEIILYDSRSHHTGLGIKHYSIEETVDTFILIASEEKLNNPYVFEQRAFGNCFGQRVDSLEDWHQKNGLHLRGDVQIKRQTTAKWIAKRIEIKLTR